MATLDYTYSAPNIQASEWLIVAPAPPNLPSQNDIAVTLSIPDDPSASLTSVWEYSPERRALLQIEAPVEADPKLANLITARWVCEATLYKRKLVPGLAGRRAPSRFREDNLLGSDADHRLLHR
ncbi:MAG TPA: hypothetical protein VFW40_09775 [Capsulimonadaceae bacterium]|nr:hypothetical protein [Capsulimonadaceae bacterium]